MLDPKQQIREIMKRIVRFAVFDAIAFALIFLAIYAKVSGPAGVFHPSLANPTVVNVLLGFGLAMAAWAVINIIGCIRELKAQADVLRLQGQ